jgi:hypothetical protein
VQIPFLRRTTMREKGVPFNYRMTEGSDLKREGGHQQSAFVIWLMPCTCATGRLPVHACTPLPAHTMYYHLQASNPRRSWSMRPDTYTSPRASSNGKAREREDFQLTIERRNQETPVCAQMHHLRSSPVLSTHPYSRFLFFFMICSLALGSLLSQSCSSPSPPPPQEFMS